MTETRTVRCSDASCSGTVIQRLDENGVWRPKPPLCGDCMAALQSSSEKFYADLTRTRAAPLIDRPRGDQ